MARRGRSRKAGERYASGRLKVVVDKGTDEAQRRRNRLAGEGDPNLTWHPLGVLRANDVISEEAYRAGCTYFELYEIVFRKTTPAAVALDGTAKRTGDEEMTPEARKHLEGCQRKLKGLMAVVDGVADRHGRGAKDQWDNLVLHMREPRWMRPVPPTVADIYAAQQFRVTLDAVTQAVSGQMRRAA